MKAYGESTSFSTLGALARAYANAVAWYLAQATLALSEETIRWLTQAPVPATLVFSGSGNVQVWALRGTRVEGRRTVSNETWLAESLEAIDKSKAPIGIGLPADRFLVRRLKVPRQVIGDIAQILDRELEAETPLRRENVFCGHIVDPSSSADSPGVEHWIVRKDLVASAARDVGLTADRINFVVPLCNDDQLNLIDIKIPTSPPSEDTPWFRRAALLLAISFIGLTVAIFMTEVRSVNSELERLDNAIARAASIAKSVRQKADDGARAGANLVDLARFKHERPALVDVLEELTRTFPDGTFLSEVRISESASGESVVSMAGLSDQATTLVPLLERSQLLQGATLTSPITPEPNTKRDRFTISAMLRRASERMP